jgi:hypothetical protein
VDAARDWRDGLLVSGAAGDRETGGPRQRLAEAGERLGSLLLEKLEDPGARDALAAFIEHRLVGANQTVGRLVRSAAGADEALIVDSLSGRVLTFLTSETTADRIGAAARERAEDFLRRNADVPLSAVLGIDASGSRALEEAVGSVLAGVPRGPELESILARTIAAADLGPLVLRLRRGTGALGRWLMLFAAATGFLAGAVSLLLRAVIFR